jgi:hypothetical protein
MFDRTPGIEGARRAGGESDGKLWGYSPLALQYNCGLVPLFNWRATIFGKKSHHLQSIAVVAITAVVALT